MADVSARESAGGEGRSLSGEVGGSVARVDLAAIQARCEQATAGPWAFETCGEKGDGSDVVGVVFGPDDEDCARPLSGELEPFDDDGNPIDYYRDEVVAECHHHNRNPRADAAFIAHARTDIPALLAEIRALRAERDALDERAEMSGGCLAMIHDELVKWIPMDGCPPMFYPEAIHNVAVMPRRAIMRAIGATEVEVANADEEGLIALIRRALHPASEDPAGPATPGEET